MKIDFTKKEFRLLIDLLQIADWVMHSNSIDMPEETKPYWELEQKIFSFAEKIGLGNLITREIDQKEYLPTQEYEKNSPYMNFIEEFENDSFWDSLIHRLAMRDLFKKEGKDRVDNMSTTEYFEKLVTFEQRYQEEFESHGISRLDIDNFGEGHE